MYLRKKRPAVFGLHYTKGDIQLETGFGEWCELVEVVNVINDAHRPQKWTPVLLVESFNIPKGTVTGPYKNGLQLLDQNCFILHEYSERMAREVQIRPKDFAVPLPWAEDIQRALLIGGKKFCIHKGRAVVLDGNDNPLTGK